MLEIEKNRLSKLIILTINKIVSSRPTSLHNLLRVYVAKDNLNLLIKRRKRFYLMMYSTHFIYGYMASDH